MRLFLQSAIKEILANIGKLAENVSNKVPFGLDLE
jgi:hypothetical protein